MDSKAIGLMISKERKKKGFTQKQLADELSVSDKTISKWETGKSLPDIVMLNHISEFFDIGLNELVAGERISEENYAKTTEKNIEKLLLENEKYRKQKSSTVLGIIAIAISVAVILLILIGTDFSRLRVLVDVVALVIEIGILVGLKLLGRFNIGIVIPLGVVISLINFVLMMTNTQTERVIENVSVCLLPALYGLIIYIVIKIINTKNSLQKR